MSDTLDTAHRPSTARERRTTGYYHAGYKVNSSYIIVHTIGMNKYLDVKKSFLQDGLKPRYRKLKCKMWYINTITLESTGILAGPHTTVSLQQKLTMLSDFSPTTLNKTLILGYKSAIISLLPSSTRKRRLWLCYYEDAQLQGIRAARRSHFQKL